MLLELINIFLFSNEKLRRNINQLFLMMVMVSISLIDEFGKDVCHPHILG